MATKMKKPVITGVSDSQANDAFAEYAKSDASINKITAEIELQCAKVREKYAERLQQLGKERDDAFAILQSYAIENPSLFLKKKSYEMAHGVIGFRTGMPKLKLLKGFTWASALELVKRFLPGYVRTSEEVAKDRLLDDRDVEFVSLGVTEPMSKRMSDCGIQVVQEESFYVEPKTEEQL